MTQKRQKRYECRRWQHAVIEKIVAFCKNVVFLNENHVLGVKTGRFFGNQTLFGKSLEMLLEAFLRFSKIEMTSFAHRPVDLNVLVDTSFLWIPVVFTHRRCDTTRYTMDLRELKLLLIL